MNLKKKLIINKLSPVIFSEKEKEIILYVKYLLSNLEIFKIKSKYPEVNFYINTEMKECIFHISNDSILNYEYKGIWVGNKYYKEINDKFKLDYHTTLFLFQYFLNDVLNTKIHIDDIEFLYDTSYSEINQSYILSQLLSKKIVK